MMKLSKALLVAFFLSLSINLLAADFGHPLPAPQDILLTLGKPTKAALPKRIQFLVWNLHKGSDADFSKDFSDLAYKKDIIASQEMLLNPLMISVFSTLPDYLFASATSFFMGSDLYRTGVISASPVKPIEVQYIKTETLEPVVSSPKMTIVTRYPIANTDKFLTVVNIHGINFVDGASYKVEMERIYDQIKNYPSPMVFAGDFNTWSDERMSILSSVASRLNLVETHFFPDERMKFNNHKLDHFLYTEDLRIIEAKVEGFYKGSDHKPLEVLVEYSPRPSKRLP